MRIANYKDINFIILAVQEISNRYFNLADFVENKIPPQVENADLYTLEEVSEIVSMSIVTIRQYVRTGKLKAIKQWKNWMVSSNEIARLLYERKFGEKIPQDEPVLVIVDGELYEENSYIKQYQIITIEMEDLVRQKNIEFTKVLESYKNCKVKLVSETRKMYNIVSKSGVNWKERSLKWGGVAKGKKRLRIDLDYPVHSFTAEELSFSTGLPLKRNITKPDRISHINPTIGGEEYDTLRIILYGDKLETYDFENEKLIDLLKRIVAKNIS